METEKKTVKELEGEIWKLRSEIDYLVWLLDDDVQILCNEGKFLHLDGTEEAIINVVTRDLMQIRSELEKLSGFEKRGGSPGNSTGRG